MASAQRGSGLSSVVRCRTASGPRRWSHPSAAFRTCFAHVRQHTAARNPREQSQARSEGKPIERGDRAMTKLFRSTEAAEIFALEHRLPFAATLFSLFMAGNVGSAVLM